MKTFPHLPYEFACGLSQRLKQYQAELMEFGLTGFMQYHLRVRNHHRGPAYGVHSDKSRHPMYIRPGTSDAEVFFQIFSQQEYAPLYKLHDVRTVVDCGANVGYASLCFLHHFPSCHIIAIEPDPENFALLERNLRGYANRASLIQAGIWSHTAPLVVSRGTYGDGREWAVQVRPCRPHEEPDFFGITIDSILSQSGHDRISLLKMDIEGAEAVVFRGRVDWLDHVDAIAIELHDDSQFGNASEPFFAAIEGRGFEVSQSGELTICMRER